MLSLALARAATADSLRVVVRPHSAGEVAGATVTIGIRDTRSSDAKRIELPIEVPGSATVDLPAGHYVIESRSASWWIAPQLAVVRGATVVELTTRRMTLLTATVTSGQTANMIPAVGFQAGDQDRVSGESRCALQDGAVRCRVPEGVFDLRLSIPGHVPHYWIDFPVVRRDVQKLGAIAFVSGASISGRVEVTDGALRRAKVQFAPIGSKSTVTIDVPEHGFFAHGPVPPGDYTVTALQKGLISAPVSVTIREGMEAQLREPLILAKPRRIEAALAPSATPIGTPWHVQLARLTDGARPVVVTRGASSPDGTWTADQLPPGEYELTVRPQGGPVWHSERLSLVDAVTWLPVTLKGVRFRGTVRLGDEPLAAELIFGGEHSEHRLPWSSDERGEFRGYLPVAPEGGWLVTVKSEKPSVHTTLNGIVPLPPADSGEVAIDLRLPANTIRGDVVDEKGAPVSGALINVAGRSAGSDFMQIEADESGSFELHGMAAGTYTLSAADYLKESDTIQVVLAPDETSPPRLRLALKPYRHWKGRVTTAGGHPVTNAKVLAVPVDVSFNMVIPARTDADGRFAALVPPDARLFDVHVRPTGHAFSLFRQSLTEELNIVLDGRGGTLVIDTFDDHARTPVLWHNGASINAHSLLSGWIGKPEKAEQDRVRLRIPQMEAGEYAICLMTAAPRRLEAPHSSDCTTVYLAPYAEQLVRLDP